MDQESGIVEKGCTNGESERTEISAARDNRRRQYFNRRQIYRPREMANASNVPFRRSYPLLLASFLLTGGVIRRNEPTLAPSLSPSGSIIPDQSTVEKKKWRNSREYFVGRNPKDNELKRSL